MHTPEIDTRSAERRARDEAIAAEPHLPFLDLPDSAVPVPVEQLLARLAPQPLAITGIVENGLIRPLKPAAKLVENASVIIIMSE